MRHKFVTKHCADVARADVARADVARADVARNLWASMRVCADCHFRQHARESPAPAAALVLAFSSSHMHGPGGVLMQIQQLSKQQHMPMAAAYCCLCRQCTWLCSTDVDLNTACLDFLHLSRSTEKIQQAAALMHASN